MPAYGVPRWPSQRVSRSRAQLASIDTSLAVTVFESVWNTNTTPKTVTVTGCLNNDWLAVLAIGNQNTTSGVTAATSSTTAGTTGAWTELAEDLDSTTNVEWYHTARAQVTANGDVTVQVDRTGGGASALWGFYVIRGRNCGAVNLAGQLGTAGTTQVINCTVSEGSTVAVILADWNAGTAPTAWTPAGQIVVESSSPGAPDYTVAAAYWTGQTAGTRNYGSTNWGGTPVIKGAALELTAAGAAGSFSGTASLPITDTITSAGAAQGAASVTTTATITASGVVATSSGASLTVTASTTAAATAQGSASLTETATITAASGALSGASSLTITDAITAAGTPQGSASPTWAATITAGGVVATSSGATLTITADRTAAGTGQGSASLTETATITAGAGGDFVGAATRATTASITAAAQTQGAATRTTTATITAAGVVAVSGSASLTVTATISASAGGTVSGSATLTETAAVTAAGQSSSTATRTTTATITAAGAVSAASGATLTETATITAAGNLATQKAATLTETVTVTAAGSAGFAKTASLTVSAAVTAAGVVFLIDPNSYGTGGAGRAAVAAGRSGWLPFGESLIIPFTIPEVIESEFGVVSSGKAGSALVSSGRTGRG